MTVTGPARFYGPASALALAGMMWRMGWFWWFPARQIGDVLPITVLLLFFLTAFAVSILGVACGAMWLLIGLINAMIGLMPHKPHAPSDIASRS